METASRDEDLLHLKAKVDAGLDFVVTQLFFDNAFYFDFVERARRVGINVPIVPGIMPITNYEQVQRFTRMCGAPVPMRLALQLERVKDRPEAVMQLGVAHATVQCMELLGRGVPGIHFYTLNKSPATRMIVSALRARTGADRRETERPEPGNAGRVGCCRRTLEIPGCFAFANSTEFRLRPGTLARRGKKAREPCPACSCNGSVRFRAGGRLLWLCSPSRPSPPAATS